MTKSDDIVLVHSSDLHIDHQYGPDIYGGVATMGLRVVLDAAAALDADALLVAGDMDELCTPQDIETFRSNLAGSSELWLYEGIFHPMGEVSAEIYPAMADWMLTTLNDGRPAG